MLDGDFFEEVRTEDIQVFPFSITDSAIMCLLEHLQSFCAI